MQWKSLDAYKFFKSGYVRTIRVWASGSSCCVVRALVNPSQKAPEKASRAWIGLRPDGKIVAEHCTCMHGWVSFNDQTNERNIYSPESCYIYYLCGVLIRFKVVFNYNPQAW